MTYTVQTPKDYVNADVDNIVTGNSVNVFSWLPDSVQSDVLAGTATYDVTVLAVDSNNIPTLGLAAAHAAAGVGGKVFYPPGTYPCSNVGFYDAQSIIGSGPTSTILTKSGLLGAEGNHILAPYNFINDITLQHKGGNLVRDMGFTADATSLGGFAIVDFANRGRIENCTIIANANGTFGGIRLSTNTISGYPITNNNNISGTHCFNNAINGCTKGGIVGFGTLITAISVNVSITVSRTMSGSGGANTYTDQTTDITFSGTSSGTKTILVANTTGLNVGDLVTGPDIVTDLATDAYFAMNIIQNCGSLDGTIASIDSPNMSGWIFIQNKLEHSPGGLINCSKGAQSLLIANNLFDWQCNDPTNGTNICLNIAVTEQGRCVVVDNQFKGNNFFDPTKTAVFINFGVGVTGGAPTGPNICSDNTFNFAGNPTSLTCINVALPSQLKGVAEGNTYDSAITDAQRGNGDAAWAPARAVPIISGITAHAGGGQGSAMALTWGFNEVQVCATNGDSVKLPAAIGSGKSVEVGNDGAANLAVFPGVGDKINRGSANASVTVNAGLGASFRDFAVGIWRSFP